MNTVEAIYENGVFRPIQKVDFEDGERVKMTVEITVKTKEEKDPAETIPDMAIDMDISDFALNIDHYLYGLPKQSKK